MRVHSEFEWKRCSGARRHIRQPSKWIAYTTAILPQTRICKFDFHSLLVTTAWTMSDNCDWTALPYELVVAVFERVPRDHRALVAVCRRWSCAVDACAGMRARRALCQFAHADDATLEQLRAVVRRRAHVFPRAQILNVLGASSSCRNANADASTRQCSWFYNSIGATVHMRVRMRDRIIKVRWIGANAVSKEIVRIDVYSDGWNRFAYLSSEIIKILRNAYSVGA